MLTLPSGPRYRGLEFRFPQRWSYGKALSVGSTYREKGPEVADAKFPDGRRWTTISDPKLPPTLPNSSQIVMAFKLSFEKSATWSRHKTIMRCKRRTDDHYDMVWTNLRHSQDSANDATTIFSDFCGVSTRCVHDMCDVNTT